MVSPYRAGESPKAPNCPRCKKPLPPTDVAACAKGCGTWVSAFAATVVLTEADRKPDPVTRWWRVREACPLCGNKMALCGEEPGLLQGCSFHGYFVDADTIEHTGLARPIDTEALDAKRANTEQVEAERESLAEAEERERVNRLDVERREATAAMLIEVTAPDPAITRQLQAAAPSRRMQLVRGAGTTAGAIALVEYVLALEARVARLEQTVEALGRQPTT